jgi:hypothetical protein
MGGASAEYQGRGRPEVSRAHAGGNGRVRENPQGRSCCASTHRRALPTPLSELASVAIAQLVQVNELRCNS